MTRTGKIARLPHDIREALNRCLQRNTPGVDLVDWLNSIPEVQEILENLFEGKPISSQNLSEWRHGGFAEWQAENDFLERLRNVAFSSETIEATCGHMADHAARLLSARMALIIADPSSSDDALANLKHLTPLVRNLTLLRRADHSAARLKLAQQQAFDLTRNNQDQRPAAPSPFPETRRDQSNQIQPQNSCPPKPEPSSRPETQAEPSRTVEQGRNGTAGTPLGPNQIEPPNTPTKPELKRGPGAQPEDSRAVQRGTSGTPGKRSPESPTSPGGAQETSPTPLPTPFPTVIVTQPNVTITPAAASADPAPLSETDLWQMRHRDLPTDPSPDWRMQLPIKTALPSWLTPFSYKTPPPTRTRMPY